MVCVCVCVCVCEGLFNFQLFPLQSNEFPKLPTDTTLCPPDPPKAKPKAKPASNPYADFNVVLTQKNFDEVVLGSSQPWIVEFFAVWSCPCVVVFSLLLVLGASLPLDLAEPSSFLLTCGTRCVLFASGEFPSLGVVIARHWLRSGKLQPTS